jgi:hypothetical protein
MNLEVIENLCRPGRASALSLDEAIYSFHALGPRVRFLKTLPLGAAVLDAGAGEGSLQVFRTWPEPKRDDLKLFAWAGEKGAGFDLYDGHEVGFWPEHKPRFGGRAFDAVLAANFIEHIDDPISFVDWATSLLTRHGYVYLEWPRPEAINLPTTAELASIGLPIMTGNYFDDATHRQAMPRFVDVRDALVAQGLKIREAGTVRVPFIDQELAIHAAAARDTVHLTLAYWSLTGWCQYLIAER